jgi:hypothetical protein
MFNDGRVGEIEYYKQQLANLGQNTVPVKQESYWQKLTDYCNKMSADQQSFVSNSKEVQESRAKMMEAFNLYLFERYKDEFIQLDDFRGLCDKYVESVITISKDYSVQIAKTVDENESLKTRIAELERKLYAKSDTSRT